MSLAGEAQRYLAVVDTFRREGCEPRWRPESRLERMQLSSTPLRVLAPDPERRKSCPD